MEFTRDQRATALDTLPKETRRFIVSDEFAEKLHAITKSQGLLLDQAGALEDELLLAILGLKPIAGLSTNIQNRLSLPSEKSQALVQAINNDILGAIREKMKGESRGDTEEEVTVYEQPVHYIDETSASKEALLAEIENPTPTIHPISKADQTLTGPRQPLEIVSPSVQKAAAHEFIGAKLTETVSLPSQKSTETVPQSIQKSKTYSADPYREPLM